MPARWSTPRSCTRAMSTRCSANPEKSPPFARPSRPESTPSGGSARTEVGHRRQILLGKFLGRRQHGKAHRRQILLGKFLGRRQHGKAPANDSRALFAQGLLAEGRPAAEPRPAPCPVRTPATVPASPRVSKACEHQQTE